MKTNLQVAIAAVHLKSLIADFEAYQKNRTKKKGKRQDVITGLSL